VKFLQICPTDDSAYSTIVSDFQFRVGNFGVTAATLQQDVKAVCDFLKPGIVQFPISSKQETEYLVMQLARTIYYMDNQRATSCQYPYPWTQGKSLYQWMQKYIGGFNIRSDVSALSCCDSFGGLPLVRVPLNTASNFALFQTIPWAAVSMMIPPLAEFTRPTQSSQFALTNCAPNPPCQAQVGVNDPACDQSYDLTNLSGGGIQYWLRVAWLTEKINVGDACMAPHDALVTRQMFLSTANASAQDDFCSNPPPAITGPLNPSGPPGNCVGFYNVPRASSSPQK